MDFANSLFERINYNTKISSAKIGFDNLKKLSPSLTEDSIYALALMASNPAISEEEREIFKKCLELKCKSEMEVLEKTKDIFSKNG